MSSFECDAGLSFKDTLKVVKSEDGVGLRIQNDQWIMSSDEAKDLADEIQALMEGRIELGFAYGFNINLYEVGGDKYVELDGVPASILLNSQDANRLCDFLREASE